MDGFLWACLIFSGVAILLYVMNKVEEYRAAVREKEAADAYAQSLLRIERQRWLNNMSSDYLPPKK